MAHLARRFFGACPGARHVVLMDETRGAMDVGAYEKISHTDDTEALGLPRHREANSLWFNSDYAFYILRKALPHYEYYVFSESDVAVNLSLTPLLAAVAKRRLDFVARDIRPAAKDWYWYAAGAAHFKEPWRALLMLSVLSGKALDYLYRRRVALAQSMAPAVQTWFRPMPSLWRRPPPPESWPFCEAFVMSALHAARRFAVADLNEFAHVEHLNYRPRLSLNDPRANRAGALAHAVLGSRAFIAAMLQEYPARSYFNATSEMRERLCHEPHDDVLSALQLAFCRAGDRAGQAEIEKAMSPESLSPDGKMNLARNKPALSSSVSPWSHDQIAERDAAGANGDVVPEDYGFHTDMERAPWWLVDLAVETVVDEVRIINRRLFHPERFMTFQILSSRDGDLWVSRFIKTDLSPVSQDPLQPWRHVFADPFVARFVKIALIGEGILHLANVAVFGRRIFPTVAADAPEPSTLAPG